MNTSTVDSLVAEYLDRLNVAAQSLPPDRRTELVNEISEHIEAARAVGAAADEAALRTLLDRLGEPEEIVAAARDGEPPVAAPLPEWRVRPAETALETRPSTLLETWALIMLTAGSLIPVIGWLVGAVLLWLSRRWRWWEKLVATLVVPFGPGLVILLGSFATSSESCSTTSRGSPAGFVQGPTVCTTSGPPIWAGRIVAAVIIVAPLIVALVLYGLVRSRVAREPSVTRTVWVGAAPGSSPWSGLEIAAVLTLGIGAFIVPVVGPLVGLALAWSSPRWSDNEKTAATLITVIPGVIIIAVLAALIL